MEQRIVGREEGKPPPPPAPPSPPAPASIPSEEGRFIRQIAEAAAAYASAPNEIKKSTLRKHRAKALKEAMDGHLQFFRWRGTLRAIGTNRDGKAHVEVALPGGPLLKTWNNDVSDHRDHTLISVDSPLYAALGEMRTGQEVLFSGTLLPSAQDFAKESSLTEEGSMTEPEFIVRFSEVKPAP